MEKIILVFSLMKWTDSAFYWN